jgi:hypothetical protein
MITKKTKKRKFKSPRKINTKSKKYKNKLQYNIRKNLGKYKKGFYKTKNQALAISYKQTNKHFKNLNNY